MGKQLLMLIVLYGCAFIAGFNENLVNMSLVSIMSDFSVDTITANWLVTGYMIVATIVVTCMAYMFRRFKLRRLFFSAALLSIAGSLMGMLAQNFAILLIGRLIQAIGTGVFIPLMMNTVMMTAPKARLSTFLSIGTCMITFGPALSPVVCGALTTAIGWRSVFIVPIAVLAVFSIAGFFLLKNLETAAARLDLPSLVFISIAIIALSLSLAEITTHPLLAIIALAAMLISGALFTMRQNHCKHPLINLAPLKNRSFSPTLILTMIGMMSTFSLSVLLPLYLETSCSLTPFAAGLLMLIPALINAVTSIIGGRIMDLSGEWPLIPSGFAILTVGLFALSFIAPKMSLVATFIVLAILYAAVGLVMSPSQSAGLKRLPRELNTFGVALSTTCIQIAACIGPALYTGILSGVQNALILSGESEATALANGLSSAMIVAGIIAGVGLIIATIYSRKVSWRAGKIANSNTI
jgi:DHA2 family lincomycin resistance protein-like MFS transporter